MKTYYIILIILLSAGPLLAQSPEDKEWKTSPFEGEWEQVEDEENMKVYTRLSEESKYKEIKMDFTINASCETIIEYIGIAEKFPEWIYTCSEAYSIPDETGKDIYYIRFDMTWPVSDRDIVQYSVTKKDVTTGIYTIRTRAIEGKIPEKKRVVRITENNIAWKLIPLGPDRTRILYYAINNPGGWVPAWIMNMLVTIGPRHTMNKLTEELE